MYDYFQAQSRIPYDDWIDRVEGIWRKNNLMPKLVLDLGCGTGAVTTRFKARGYDMIGIDLSPDMLAQAQAKPESEGILYLNQDMRAFELYGTVDAVICLCDGINYLLTEEDLAATFGMVNNYLNPGGLLVFDLKTEKCFSGLGNQTFADQSPDAAYICENQYDSQTQTCQFTITLFYKTQNNLFRRSEETHRQRAYSPHAIEEAITKSGLRFVEYIPGNEQTWDYYVAAKIM